MTETKNKLNYISIKGLFWMQFKEHLVSFGFKGLPTDQHFTISFNAENDINFHITKNVANSKNKPKIPILSIDKKIASSDFGSLFLAMLFNVLKPIDIDELKKKTELEFISFSQLEKDNSYSKSQQKLFDSFRDISKIKQKTRLKINSKWEEELVTYFTSDDMLNLVNKNITEFNETEENGIDSGILLSNGNVIQVMKIYSKWYEFNTDIKPIDLFSGIIDRKIVNLIWLKIKRSIVSLKKVQTYKETEHLNKPIQLIKKQNRVNK